MCLTTDRRGRRNPSRQWLLVISPYRPSACRSGGGPSHGVIAMTEATDPSLGVGRSVASGNPVALQTGQGGTDEGPGGIDRTLQRPTHGSGEDGLAQEAGTRAVPAALLSGPQAQGGIQDRARPAQYRTNAYSLHGAGLASGASGPRHDPDLFEFSAGADDVSGQTGFRARA